MVYCCVTSSNDHHCFGTIYEQNISNYSKNLFIRISEDRNKRISHAHCRALSGRGLCVGLFTRPQEFYRVWCVWVWSWILDNEEALAPWAVAIWGGGRAGSYWTLARQTPKLTLVYASTGKRTQGQPLKRLAYNWDRNGSTIVEVEFDNGVHDD